jgi:hypothetical protein
MSASYQKAIKKINFSFRLMTDYVLWLLYNRFMSSIEAFIPSPESSQSPVEKPYAASVLTPQEAMTEWKIALPHAKKVNLIFMSAPGGEGQPLEELKPLLQNTARTTTEGNVRMGIGKYDLHNPVSGPPTFPFLKRNSQEQEIAERNQREITIATRRDLEESGVKIHKTKGQGFSSRLIGFANYNHAKAVQISLTEEERVITYLPEFNLHKENLDALNSALRFEETSEQAKAERSIAKTVGRYIDKAYNREPFKDYEEEVTDKLLFLADGGRPGRSIIKGKAIGLVKERDTENIFFASQFPPAGSMLKEMIIEAKKGNSVTVLLSDDCQPGQSMDIACFHRKVKGLNNFHVLYANGKVHSKWLLVNSGIIGTESRGESNNTMKGISSSNNLHPAGYWTGTGEMGFLIQDQELLGKMRDRAMEMINSGLERSLPESPQSSSRGIEGGVLTSDNINLLS